MGLKSSSTGGGEIVQVQGGHIIRATGRKDRHSKVFTAKGPRDRRVRLSAHTAIQFYDVQDRLGYDRPSKAVDWLMKKAKASIDKLAELPPWDPTASASTAAVDDVNGGGGCTEFHVGDHSGSSSCYAPQPQPQPQPQCVGPHHQSSLVGNSDSMKSFFPMNNDTNHASGENSISFHNYPHELISRGASQNQDLCLSLHTLQDPSGGAHGGSAHHHQNTGHDSTLFHGSGSSLGFDGGPGGWVDPHHPHDLGRFSRMLGWPMGAAGASAGSGAGNTGGGDHNRGGNFFNPPPFPQQGLLLGQQGPISTTTYSQRGTLQSSFSPLVRVLEDQQHHHQHQHQHQPEIPNMVHASSDGFMGFYIPSQVHGHELHDGANSISNRASSSSLSPDSSQH